MTRVTANDHHFYIGALATLVASYITYARGSGEPESSMVRQKELEHFIRDCESFQMDHGYTVGHEFEYRLNQYRDRLEEILDNDPTKE